MSAMGVGGGGALGNGANPRTITSPKQSRLELIQLLTRPLGGHCFRFRELIFHKRPPRFHVNAQGQGREEGHGQDYS